MNEYLCVTANWSTWPISAILVTVVLSAVVIGLVLFVVNLRQSRHLDGAVKSHSVQKNAIAENKKTNESTNKFLGENVHVADEYQLRKQAVEAGEDTAYASIREYEALAPRPEQRGTSEPYQDLRQFADKRRK